MKKVSVIIPCYNAIRWLPQCFLSLVRQTIGIDTLELIFVDDASTDEGETWAMLMEFEQAYPESVISIHLGKNMRQGGARNVAMQYATGEYIAFVDADDFVADDFLEKVYQKAIETDADIVQFGYYYYTQRTGAVLSEQQEKAEEINIKTIQQRKELLITEKITYGCWNKIYRRSMVTEAGVKYAEHVIYEEPLFVYPLLYVGNCFVIMEEAFYYYRQNVSGTMWNDMKQQQTLKMHAEVQRQVWEFMKQTKFFLTYYEEIKLYFLHTYLFETLLFAKRRNHSISMEWFRTLEQVVMCEVPDFKESKYAEIIPLQMKLYRMIGGGMTSKWLKSYMDNL